MPRKIYGVTAQQTNHQTASPDSLTVKVTVQTLTAGEKLGLFETIPDKSNAGTLTLEVQGESGTGAQVLGITTVEYHNRTFAARYDKVTVITDDNSCTVSIQVGDS